MGFNYMENSTIEYKRELTDNLEKEVVAFLNSQGGTIIIGKDDDGNSVNIENPDKIALMVADRIKNNILPSAMGIFNIDIEQEGENNIVVITVASGLEKPYYLSKFGRVPRGCYIRIGTQTAQMPQNKIDEMFSKRIVNTLHNVVSPNQELTFSQLKIFYEEKGYDVSNEYFLKNLGLYTDDNKFNYAAFLLSDNNDTSIKVARFKGIEKLDILERNEFGRCCLIKSAINVLEKLKIINTTVVRVGGDAQRKEYKLIDEDALREAVLNAIIHNDYINGAYPVVEVYDDRIEIVSSGGLPVGLSKGEFFEGRSLPRNKELMRVFSDMDLCEQLGSGTRKILKHYSKEVFNISEHFISVALPYNDEAKNIIQSKSVGNDVGNVGNDVGDIKMSEKKVLIYKMLQEEPTISAESIAQKLGVNKRTIERNIKELRESRYIERVGGTRGCWKILK